MTTILREVAFDATRVARIIRDDDGSMRVAVVNIAKGSELKSWPLVKRSREEMQRVMDAVKVIRDRMVGAPPPPVAAEPPAPPPPAAEPPAPPPPAAEPPAPPPPAAEPPAPPPPAAEPPAPPPPAAEPPAPPPPAAEPPAPPPPAAEPPAPRVAFDPSAPRKRLKSRLLTLKAIVSTGDIGVYDEAMAHAAYDGLRASRTIYAGDRDLEIQWGGSFATFLNLRRPVGDVVDEGVLMIEERALAKIETTVADRGFKPNDAFEVSGIPWGNTLCRVSIGSDFDCVVNVADDETMVTEEEPQQDAQDPERVSACQRAAKFLAKRSTMAAALDDPSLLSDPHTTAARTALNVCAAWTAAATVVVEQDRGGFLVVKSNTATEEDRAQMAWYSGLGGLSAKEHARLFPPTFPKPDERGLLDEFYTPTRVCKAIHDAVKGMLDRAPRVEGKLKVLEPSAGIGRFREAFSGLADADWYTVELSRTSATMLAARFPADKLYLGSFESWCARYAAEAHQRIGLVVSNPPYPALRAYATDDPDPSYRERRNYLYFLRRSADLLGAGGVGVYVIPAGFMSGVGDEMRDAREAVLKRHHLAAAFRLPSDIFPGALLPVDVVILRSRGGSLPATLADDAEILDGLYFQRVAPTHILGKEVGSYVDTPSDERHEGEKDKRNNRWQKYQVEGTFTGFPEFLERPMPADAVVAQPAAAEAKSKAKAKGKRGTNVSVRGRIEVRTEGLSEALAAAVTLGASFDKFSTLLADNNRECIALWPELAEGMALWSTKHGNPWAHLELRDLSSTDPAAARFLQAFTPKGALVPSMESAPVIRSAYQGDPADIPALADFYRLQDAQGKLSIPSFALRISEELQISAEDARAKVIASLPMLRAAGWYLDGAMLTELVPAADYLSGSLWPKYDAVDAILKRHSPSASDAPFESGRVWGVLDVASIQQQKAELLAAIKPELFPSIEFSVRQGWVPLTLVNAWMQEYFTYGGTLDYVGGLFVVKGVDYDDIGVRVPENVRDFLGYLNHDYTEFRPQKKYKEGSNDKENIDEARIRIAREWELKFNGWVNAVEERQAALENAYNRVFRGFVDPDYGSEPIKIARWGASAPQPHPYQWRAARRVIANGRGLLALDVGLGKTLTSLVVLAVMKQRGIVRRPIILVPLAVAYQWVEYEIARLLPDYKVVVIGARKREITRGPNKGKIESEADGVEQQGAKWSRFQAGEYDVAVVTREALARTAMSVDSVVEYARKTTAIQREVKMRQRNLRKKKVMDLTEREEAILKEGTVAWVKEILEPGKGKKFVPGILWDQIGIDFVVIDEAQGYKNLYLPEAREGGVPKYMGSAGEGSNRAWQLDFRLEAVRRLRQGAGVLCLSATPAKNSPLEFYTMLQYVDHDVWQSRGIYDPEMFTDRYLKLELKSVIGVDMSAETASAVVGFTNLHELREVLGRYAEFRTAEEVNLKIPRAVVSFIDAKGGSFTSETTPAGIVYRDSSGTQVPVSEVGIAMNGEQERKYQRYVDAIEDALSNARMGDPGSGSKVLSLLAKMSLVAAHQWLDEKYDWDSAESVSPEDAVSPKFEALATRIVNAMSCGQAVLCAAGSEQAVADKIADLTAIPAKQILVLDSDTQRSRLAKFAHGRIRQEDEFDIIVTSAERWSASGYADKACGVVRVQSEDQIEKAASHVLLARVCGHIVFCDNVAAHRWIKKVLVARGIPAGRIAVLNAKAAEADERTNIAKGFNGNLDEGIAPIYDVVLANQVAYEGVNLQTRTCQIHHIDLPWEPATLQQRNGRGVRQGNLRMVVGVNYYFSKRSMDGLRFGLIAGKVGWMKALLASQERSTNNPAAQMDLGPDELLLLLSRNPEDTQKRLEEIKQKAREELKKKQQAEAAALLRRINAAFRKAERVSNDPVASAAARAEGEAQLARLVEYDAEVWPWTALAPVVRERAMLVVDEGHAPVYEGLKVVYTDAFGSRSLVHFGRVNGDKIAVRQFGKYEWREFSMQDVKALKLTPEQIDPPWDTAEDDRLAYAGLVQRTKHYAYNMWKGLSITQADDAWLARVWEALRDPILAACARDQSLEDTMMPVPDGEGIRFASPREGRFDVLAPTAAGWAEVLRRAAFTNGDTLKYSVADHAASWWWGRKFPTGAIGGLRHTLVGVDYETVEPMEGMRAVDKLFNTVLAGRLAADRDRRARGLPQDSGDADLLEQARRYDSIRQTNTARLVERDRAIPVSA